MNSIEEIWRRIGKVLEATEDTSGQAAEDQLPVLPDDERLQETRTLGAIFDKAESHCDKAETAMLRYIRSQSE